MLAVSIPLIGSKTKNMRRRRTNRLMDHILIIVRVRRMDVGRDIVSAFIKVKAVTLRNVNAKIAKIRMIM